MASEAPYTIDHLAPNGAAHDASSKDGAKRPTLRVINPAEFEGKPVPARGWIVSDLIPTGTVTILSGDGGIGKTILGLQVCTAMATARDWIGKLPTPGRSLYLSAEDDTDELHRRLEAIRASHGVTWSDLQDMRVVDLVGDSAVLGEAAGNGIIKATLLFQAVERYVAEFEPLLVAIDALADAFAGDEINRSQVRQFVGLLKRLCRRHGCAVLLLAHPSVAGMTTGTGTSGSTAWSNSVRSRLYFEAAKASDDSEPDPDLRVLTAKKANYAKTGTTLLCRWKAGVFVAETSGGALDKLAANNRADDVFLKLLRQFNAQGQRVSPRPCSTWAPKVFAKHPDGSKIGQKALEKAMQRLLDAGAIIIEETGPPSTRRTRLVVAGE